MISPPQHSVRRTMAFLAVLVFPFLQHVSAQAVEEFRGLWVDTFHDSIFTPSEVTALVRDARAGNFNAVVVEVRRRGDAFHQSNFEPMNTGVAAGFDPLADLVEKAHDTSGGRQRLEVHAWIVTFPIWGSDSIDPPQDDHPFNLHPDWLTRDHDGEIFSGSSFVLDPGHPEVQEHTFNVGMDILRNYAVDGLHFDYVRYLGNTWGYNPVAVERFQEIHDRQDVPRPTDDEWLQFRRNQVTELVRRVYLHAADERPEAVISAATITFAPGVTLRSQWEGTAAYSRVLQDWRAWMEEGILDINMPMTYFRESTHAEDWDDWTTFIKNHQYGRQSAIGAAFYLNSVSQTLDQLREAREATFLQNRAAGIMGYSYANTSNDGVSRATFLNALTEASVSQQYESESVPLFAERAEIPARPWKEDPQQGHIMGFVRTADGLPADGVPVDLVGRELRSLRTDALGFYGFANLAPGGYDIQVAGEGLETARSSVNVTAGEVAKADFTTFGRISNDGIVFQEVAPGERQAYIRFIVPDAGADAQVLFGKTTSLDREAASSPGTKSRLVLLAGLEAGATYFFRIVAKEGSLQSGLGEFDTAGDIIVDDEAADFFGKWREETGGFPSFEYAEADTSGLTTAYATFRPNIMTPGRYDVYVRVPVVVGTSQSAPLEIRSAEGVSSQELNLALGAGDWRLVAEEVRLEKGTGGSLTLGNQTGEAGRVVPIDGVRFAYAEQFAAEGQLPSWYSSFFFGQSVPGQADSDGDTVSNFAEYLFGTHPADASSQPVQEMAAEEGGNITLSLAPHVRGREYQLLMSTDLSGGEWAVVEGVSPIIEAGSISFSHTPPADLENAFYRIRVSIEPDA